MCKTNTSPCSRMVAVKHKSPAFANLTPYLTGPKMPVTRSQKRTGIPLSSCKTDLQRERDHFVSILTTLSRYSQTDIPSPGSRPGGRMAPPWSTPTPTPTSLSNHSRSRPTKFPNTVYQSLTHLPLFLNWVDKHPNTCTTASTCTICALRDLAREYWDTHNANPPIPPTRPALTQIRLKASMYSALGDAYIFYEWLTS